MKHRHLLLSILVLTASSVILSACSANSRTSVDHAVLPTNTPQQDQVKEAQLEQPQSDSTNVEDLDQELMEFQVLEEDFSNL